MDDFTCVNLYVGRKIGRPVRVLREAKYDPEGPIFKMFRAAIKADGKAFTADINSPSHPHLKCIFTRYDTAGVAAWVRNNKAEAVTAYLSGVAQADEYQAELYVASKPTPITLYQWHNALKAKRPAYLNFLITPAAAEDRLISMASADLASNFFAVLGQI